jgi:outer membrane murein-binding lipoprotein Lpp
MEKKLDLILAELSSFKGRFVSIESKLDNLATTVSGLKVEVDQVKNDTERNTTRINALTDIITSQEDRIRTLEETANRREQYHRATSIRILNVPVTVGEADDDNSLLINTVYERFLKPILTIAKQSKTISSIPISKTLIESAFRPYAAPNSVARPPPVIVKLSTRALKVAIMRHKRGNIPTPTAEEQRADIQRFLIVEDITAPTHRKLKELSADQRVDKAWTVDGVIRFTLKNSTTVKKVKSVFDSVSDIVG